MGEYRSLVVGESVVIVEQESGRRVRLLGTSWQSRNVEYWLRRFGISCGCLFMAACMSLFVYWLLYIVVTEAQSWTRVLLLTVVGVVMLSSFVHALRSIARTPEERADGQPAAFRSDNRLFGPPSASSGATAGLLGYAGSVIAAFLITFVSMFVIGHVVVMFLISFQRYATVEEYLAVREWEGSR